MLLKFYQKSLIDNIFYYVAKKEYPSKEYKIKLLNLILLHWHNPQMQVQTQKSTGMTVPSFIYPHNYLIRNKARFYY